MQSPEIVTLRIFMTYRPTVEAFLSDHFNVQIWSLAHGWEYDREENTFRYSNGNNPAICYILPNEDLPVVGDIDHVDYPASDSRSWSVETGCSQIEIYSTFFYTENTHDKLALEGKIYSGSITIDNVIQGSKIIASFTSDSSVQPVGGGFRLRWMCHVTDCATRWQLINQGQGNGWQLIPTADEGVCVPRDTLQESKLKSIDGA